MIKAIEARRQSKANELIIKQKYIQLANELIDEVIEPAIMEAVENGLFKTEVVLGCDTETFRTVIRKLEQYEYYIAERNPIAKSLVIDWEERFMVGTPKVPSRYPEDPNTIKPVWKEPNFDIT